MDLFFARPDGTFLQFIYKPTFFQEKITWQNQKGESVNEYVPTLEPCGYSAYDVIHTIDIQQELLMSGVAGTQGPIYELKDSNHELLKAVYHGYREGYEEVENSSLSEEEKRSLNPTPLKTYEEYLSSHPLIFWRDPFGRVIRAVKKDYRPACMAEPIIYLYPQVKQVVDVAIDSPVNVIQSKPSYLIRPSTQIKETIVNTENTKRLPTWDLSDLYAGVDDPQLNADLTGMVAQGAAFEEKYKGRIACTDVTAELLRGALDAYEALLRAQYKPLAFASLLFSTDTTDARRGALLQRTREVGSAAATHLIFFDLEIGDMPQETFDRIIDDPQLAPYRHYLQHQRELAKHHLSEAEEKILEKTANTRGRAFGRLFTEITSRQTFRVDEEELTQSELFARFYDPDRETRKAAAAALTETLQRGSHVLNFIFNTLLHEKQIMDGLRGFPSPEAARHLDNEVDEGMVNTVAEVCVSNYDIVVEYYRLKRRLLGLDELTHYDRYAPITGERTEFLFDEAQGLVMDAFGQFSTRLAEMTEPFFSRHWIDAALRSGKQSGAYCMGVTPDLHPYVLMNYTSKPRDVMTLAHELGHGIHDVLASKQNLLNYQPALPMAETASTFGEMLVFDKLQTKLSSPQERLALLCGKIEDAFATVFRQIAMYRFEQQAHRLRREKGEQPAEAYCDLWQRTMQEMFGDSLTLGDEHKWWWLYIPHIYQTSFYVYAYAFGELLVLSLYTQYQREGVSFVPRYFDLLSAGGSAPPAQLVASMGFDIASPDFWQGGCDLIRQRVEQAKGLTEMQDSGFKIQ